MKVRYDSTRTGSVRIYEKMLTSMQSPAGRLLALLSLLQARPTWTAPELAERLRVTTRTVRRDITRLRDLGYPVTGDPGPFGGYQLGGGTGALPPLLLTDDEAVAVTVGMRVATGHGLTGFEEVALGALAKLEQVMPPRLRERVSSLHAATTPAATRAGPVVAAETLMTVAQGCRRLERLRFAYVDREGNASDRQVEPFQVVYTDQRWYLVARDPSRDAWRTFRVDRMRDAGLTGGRFVRTDPPDAAALVAQGLAVDAHPWKAVVMLHAELSWAADEIGPTVGLLEAAGEQTRLRIGAASLDWIAHYLAGLPFDFHVVEPPELRTEVRALGKRLQRLA